MHWRRATNLAALLALLLLPSVLSPVLTHTRTDALAASFYSDEVPRANGAVALVGDSLTFSYWAGLPADFVGEQWGPFQLEARSGRFTTTTTESATSGLDAVRRIRAGGFDPAVWIVALGTNDLALTYGIPGATATLIDAMMDEIGTSHRVVWVNVYNRDSVAKAVAFNNELLAAQARHPGLLVVDWFSFVSANPAWMLDDGVHMNLAGSIARNEFVAHAALAASNLPRICDPPASSTPQAPPASRFDLAADATAPAVRLCRH